jgi:hypothetical protein
MSRSKDFWEGSETNQSPGNGPVWAAADICDSLAWKAKCHGSHLHADFVEGTLALPLIEVVAGR